MPCRARGQPQPCPAPPGRSRRFFFFFLGNGICSGAEEGVLQGQPHPAGAADPTPPACSGWLSLGLFWASRGSPSPARAAQDRLIWASVTFPDLSTRRCAGQAHATPRPALWDRCCSRRIPEGPLLCSRAPVCQVLCSPVGSGPAFCAQPLSSGAGCYALGLTQASPSPQDSRFDLSTYSQAS